MNQIRFLGTAGARHVVTRQMRASGGLWYTVGNDRIVVDPGPGTLVRALDARPRFEPSLLDAIVLTHRHIDHVADVNIMVEAMTLGGTRRRGWLFAPHDALEDDPVVLRYLRRYITGITEISEGSRETVGEIALEFPIRHHHPAETFGYRLRAGDTTVCHIVDTRFFPGLIDAYRGDILILNVVLHDPDPGKTAHIDHLGLADARTLIGEIRPDAAILTHFGMSMLRAGPDRLAAEVAKSTGVEVIAARDGMTFAL